MTVALFLGSLLGAIFMGIPVAFALLVCGAVLMWHLQMLDPQILAQNLVGGADSFPLLAVPFFILAGEFMNVGGLSKRIVEVGLAFFGHLRGGLGYVAVVAAIIMASLSGSAVADTAALAAVLMPMMRQARYPAGLSAGLIAAGGIIAPVIPPSIGFIIFGVASGVSITKLFLAGIVPGVLMGVSLCVAWFFISRRENLPPAEPVSWNERVLALRRGALALALPGIIIVGLKFGIFTPTEAAVVAAVYALVVCLFVYRTLDLPKITGCLVNASRLTATVLFLVAAASVSGWLITVAELPAQLTEWAAPVIDRPMLLMFLLMGFVFLVGTALDFVPTVLILTPVMMPLVKQAGIDPVFFGVIFIMMNAIGLITPPVGSVLNVAAGVGGVSMGKVIRGVTPFLVAELVVVGLLIAFPWLVLAPLQWLTR
ncbi:MAG TPA: TRAP transporter large permease subunit [Rubrivivax sp.]|nr:TRAP transporter large permease subunit [Rubrivivax sp.]